MRMSSIAVAVAAVAVPAMLAGPVLAQKHGGILKAYHRGTPPSASIHEEATNSTTTPFMAVYNNLVIFDQHDPINTLETIQPELATEWSWNDDGTELTFQLREGVRWHDGEAFTAEDVKYTWDLVLGRTEQRLRKNPRTVWYWNLEDVEVNGDYEVTFKLGQPQPSFIALLASGYSPVYPRHISPRQMRSNPIGTGPFKFDGMQQNEYVRFVRNDDYWDGDLPYLDGIEHTIIRSRSTRVLAFANGDFDLTFTTDVSVPLMRDVLEQAPEVQCDLVPTNVSTNLIVNRDDPPFDNENIRRAMALTIDRDAFIDILSEGHFDKGGALLPPPEGVWGLPTEKLEELPGYGPDVEASREQARELMRAEGYSEDNPLNIKVSTRNIAIYRDPAVILIDHLREVFINAELEVIETANWHGMVARKDYQVGLNLTGTGVDDPDVVFFEGYSCDSERNYTGYCNPEQEELFREQSSMTDQEERQQLVWQIDEQLQRDEARPLIYHSRNATCYWPHVKNFRMMENSVYNGYRMADVWLDK